MNQEAVDKLRGMFATTGWADVVAPGVERFRNHAVLTLINPSVGEKKISDDFTRGQINVLSWMLGWPQRTEQLAAELLGEQANPVEPPAVGTVLGPSGEPTSPTQ